MHANLFSSWFNSIRTVAFGAAMAAALWFGLRWIFLAADWTLISTLGGRFIIGQYNAESACPGSNCFWRPQAVLLLFTVLMGMAWGITGRGVMKQVAIATTAAAAAFTFLPYSLDRMGLDVRLFLVANLPALAVGWGLARYTPLGTDPPDRHLRRQRFSAGAGAAAGTPGSAGTPAGVGHLLGWPDAEPTAGGIWHHVQPTHRYRTGAGASQPAPSG